MHLSIERVVWINIIVVLQLKLKPEEVASYDDICHALINQASALLFCNCDTSIWFLHLVQYTTLFMVFNEYHMCHSVTCPVLRRMLGYTND